MVTADILTRQMVCQPLTGWNDERSVSYSHKVHWDSDKWTHSDKSFRGSSIETNFGQIFA